MAIAVAPFQGRTGENFGSHSQGQHAERMRVVVPLAEMPIDQAIQFLDIREWIISGQPHDAAKAARAAPLFQDNTKGNCFDCHGRKGSGIATFGSTDLTNPNLYLYGADRAAILESITKGRHGMMTSFGDTLKPEELKAVAVFVFSHAAK